jgi:hypothetical protein
VVAAGERQLKGIDNPERVYELAIDGTDDRPLERFGQVGLRFAARLGEHVTDSLQDAKGASLEHLAARAVASLEDRLHLPHRTSD